MSNYKNPQMDWQQVVLNGGPPCFAQLDNEEGWYCGRAERWEGHDGEHKFVSLDNLLTTIRQEERRAAFKDIRDLITTVNPRLTYGAANGSVMKQSILGTVDTFIECAAALEAAAEHKSQASNEASQATHEAGASTLTPDGTARPKIKKADT